MVAEEDVFGSDEAMLTVEDLEAGRGVDVGAATIEGLDVTGDVAMLPVDALADGCTVDECDNMSGRFDVNEGDAVLAAED